MAAPPESGPAPLGRWPWWLAPALLALLHLAHPLTWGRSCLEGLWYPPVGLGLALVAWFGPRAALLMALDGLLVTLQAALLERFGNHVELPLGLIAGDALLAALQVQVGWWVYRRAGGARGLGDPRSAILFLFLVPGAVGGAFALGEALLFWLTGVPLPSFAATAETLGSWVTVLWLDRALGLLILAPPLLAAGTPFLLSRGLVRPEVWDEAEAAQREHGEAEPLTRGDWVEIAGLCAGACVLNLLLAFQHRPGGPDLFRGGPWGWPQSLGVPLLLIVWASLRQGLRGGTLVGGTASALPLLLLPVRTFSPSLALLLQANLLGQCSTALLVSASTTWLRGREARYRQIVTHAPVVLYSARLTVDRGRRPQATVTLVSSAALRVFGCPPEQLLGDHERWLRLVHPDDREVVLAALAQLRRQEEPVTCEYRLASFGPAEQPPHPQPLSPAAGARGEEGKPLSPLGRGVGGEGTKGGRAAAPVTASPPPVRWVRDVLVPRRTPAGELSGWEGVATDITEQRVLADDLRRTTGMFHTLVGNLPAGVFFVQGPHGRPILLNARARHLLGQREDAAAGLEHLTEVYRLCRPDGSPYPVEELPVYRALRQGRTCMCDDIVVHRPDGRRTPLITWAAPVSLGGRGPTRSGEGDAAVWVLEDRTALQQAEAARLDSERRLRAVVETMAEALTVQDRTGCLVDCNQAACELLGREPEQLRGRSLLDLGWTFLGEDGSALPSGAHPAQAALRLGHPVRNVILGMSRAERVCVGSGQPDAPRGPRCSPLSPSVRWLLVNAVPLGPGTAAVGVVTTFADVTHTLTAQRLLQASEERYRTLVESLPVMLIQCDRDLRLVYANPAARAATGFELAEVAEPAVWAGLIHPDDLPRLRALTEEALAGRPGRLEFRFRVKDGSDRIGFALLQPTRHEGEAPGLTALVVDVTRERALERELQRSQRLEMIGRLSSGIAHDFNNLLSVMLTLTAVARSHLPPEHPVHVDLERITQAGQQAANLAGQLLRFSRQRAPVTRPIEVNRVVRLTLELLGGVLPPNLRIEADLPTQDLVIEADETQVEQVLLNLCLNARDAMPGGGRIRIEARESQRKEEGAWGPEKGDGSATAPARWVVLSVEDEGMGISDPVRERIFDPFFTTKEGGTGLGLAVVQQIVESYGGRVEVHSQPGRGTRFDVWLQSKG